MNEYVSQLVLEQHKHAILGRIRQAADKVKNKVPTNRSPEQQDALNRLDQEAAQRRANMKGQNRDKRERIRRETAEGAERNSSRLRNSAIAAGSLGVLGGGAVATQKMLGHRAGRAARKQRRDLLLGAGGLGAGSLGVGAAAAHHKKQAA